jgi:hypothetical protein
MRTTHLPDRETVVIELITAAVAAATGAAIMYYLDPDTGRRRRALVRDRAVGLSHDAGHLALAQGRRAADHLKGAVARGRSLLHRSGPTSDYQLHGQIRARLGGIVSYPKAIHVEVDHGCVCLRGHVPADELQTLMSEIGSLPGVERVEDQLSVHEHPGDVAELQGAGRLPGERSRGALLPLLAASAPLALMMAAASSRMSRRRRIVDRLLG